MLTNGLKHGNDCRIRDVTIEDDGDCTCGAVLEHREAIITDCQAILARYLPPDGIDAHQALTELLAILDGPRGLAAAGLSKST